MYKKVLYNRKKMKKCGEGEGQYMNPQCIFKKKKRKKEIGRAGIRAYDIGVRTTCSLI